ncbi:hypothetical protein BJ508DRAFT_22337 [Ascobolus immersus RN42]|uniref:Uncharacterized protein n=1 Tax=Ascobolus immersus RN42 TaxID=1160509 RepID=A0A3N4HND1_ASCIM|nr:hypothetical protein BJ508DRAFT_22337 [Ascobolus immersus RN42]
MWELMAEFEAFSNLFKGQQKKLTLGDFLALYGKFSASSWHCGIVLLPQHLRISFILELGVPDIFETEEYRVDLDQWWISVRRLHPRGRGMQRSFGTTWENTSSPCRCTADENFGNQQPRVDVRNCVSSWAIQQRASTSCRKENLDSRSKHLLRPGTIPIAATTT